MPKTVLLLGSIGTVVESSDIQRRAYNQAMHEASLRWHWDETVYRELLTQSGGLDRLSMLARATGQHLDAAALVRIHARKYLDGRKVLHQCTGLDGIDEQNWHPLFRRHPITGETALFLSTPARCIALEGVAPALATRVLTMLYRRSQRHSDLYRHNWQPGDILIWDNRVTMHRADHDQVLGQRILHRGMVAGEKPIAAAACPTCRRGGPPHTAGPIESAAVKPL